MKSRIDTPIFITGAERSGSTLIARVLKLCGVYAGKTTKMLENTRINDLVFDTYGDLGLDLIGNLIGFQIQFDWLKEIESILIKEGYDGTNDWMYKSSNLCKTWPVWNYAYPNAKWIIVRRNKEDIIQSCIKTAHMDKFKYNRNLKALNFTTEYAGWEYWVEQHHKLFVTMMENGLNCRIIWPERMVHGDYEQIYELIDWLGFEWSNDIYTEIDPLLWHTRNKEKKGVLYGTGVTK